MKPALATVPEPRFEISCSNSVVATISGGVFSAVDGQRKLTLGEKKAVKRILARGFDGTTFFPGTGRELSITRKG